MTMVWVVISCSLIARSEHSGLTFSLIFSMWGESVSALKLSTPILIFISLVVSCHNTEFLQFIQSSQLGLGIKFTVH